jgi:hypothetical protein
MSTSEQLRKTATGVCLVAAPVLLLIGMILHPAESRDAAEQLRIIAADADRWATSHYIIALGAVLLVGAMMGLAHLLHEHRPAQAIVGGAMGVVGAMALCAVAFSEATFGASMGRNPTDDGVIEAFTAVGTSPAFLVILIGALMGPLGSIVLGHGIYQSGVAPRWTAIAFMLGGVLLAIGLPANMPGVVIAGAALHVLAMAPISIMVFGETDEEWMHTPARAIA